MQFYCFQRDQQPLEVISSHVLYEVFAHKHVCIYRTLPVIVCLYIVSPFQVAARSLPHKTPYVHLVACAVCKPHQRLLPST